MGATEDEAMRRFAASVPPRSEPRPQLCDRQFQIMAAAYAKVGIKVHEVSGGDGGEAYTMLTAPGGKYLTAWPTP